MEQLITQPPNSYVPAHTLERLVGLPPKQDNDRINWVMHWGQGILMGAIRGIMAEKGIRGPVGSFIFMNLRLLNDQTLENATGVGSLPWTLLKDEQVIDLIHKGIYAFVTGAIAGAMIVAPTSNPAISKEWIIGEGKKA